MQGCIGNDEKKCWFDARRAIIHNQMEHNRRFDESQFEKA
jgi:hypothetical protein